jgi:type IV secretion system protein VirD4
MSTPGLPLRVAVAFLLATVLFCLAYPAAFVLTHGLSPGGWPVGQLNPLSWFDHLSQLYRYKTDLLPVAGLLFDMLRAKTPALPYGGAPAIYSALLLLSVVSLLIIQGGRRAPLRHDSARYGRARWAAPRVLKAMRRGLELGRDPDTGRAVRVLIEGNLLTIAPPRTGKSSGLILPNLVMPEDGAWGGPVVVIDPKGDVHRACHRRRTAMGRRVHCLDPLDLIGGTARWNPLLHTDPADTIGLLSMAGALLPEPKGEADANQYFRDRASVLVAAALRLALNTGQTDTAAATAADLVRDPEGFAQALVGRNDALSRDARGILTLDARSRDPLVSTASQALQFLLDERLRAVMSDHTIDLIDLARDEVDLFIVAPADERRTILAPYLRWVLSNLFDTIRRNRPSERIVVIIDEANILGRCDAIIKGVGELPGYGISLWTFWQSRAQIIQTYGAAGADVMLDTAEVTTLFNTSRCRPDEAEYWSRAIGSFTGVAVSSSPNAQGQIVETRSAVEERLVPASSLNSVTQRQAIHFLSGGTHTPDPVRLDKTRPFGDPRFTGLIDPVAPVGQIKA